MQTEQVIMRKDSRGRVLCFTCAIYTSSSFGAPVDGQIEEMIITRSTSTPLVCNKCKGEIHGTLVKRESDETPH